MRMHQCCIPANTVEDIAPIQVVHKWLSRVRRATTYLLEHTINLILHHTIHKVTSDIILQTIRDIIHKLINSTIHPTARNIIHPDITHLITRKTINPVRDTLPNLTQHTLRDTIPNLHLTHHSDDPTDQEWCHQILCNNQ